MDNYYFWGMHLAWWFFLIGMCMWIFVIPYDIPGQRNSRIRKLDILDKRFAQGQISIEEYKQRKEQLLFNPNC